MPFEVGCSAHSQKNGEHLCALPFMKRLKLTQTAAYENKIFGDHSDVHWPSLGVRNDDCERLDECGDTARISV